VVLDREGDPVKIGRLQRYATDYVAEKKISVLAAPAKKSGKRVAVIGSGPAGLGCAAELAQLGHTVEILRRSRCRADSILMASPIIRWRGGES